MLGRAVTAFRKSVTKSKSSSSLGDEQEDDDQAESIASSFSSASISTSASARNPGRNTSISSMSFLRRKRRSRSTTTNHEGEKCTRQIFSRSKFFDSIKATIGNLLFCDSQKGISSIGKFIDFYLHVVFGAENCTECRSTF